MLEFHYISDCCTEDLHLGSIQLLSHHQLTSLLFQNHQQTSFPLPKKLTLNTHIPYTIHFFRFFILFLFNINSEPFIKTIETIWDSKLVSTIIHPINTPLRIFTTREFIFQMKRNGKLISILINSLFWFFLSFFTNGQERIGFSESISLDNDFLHQFLFLWKYYSIRYSKRYSIKMKFSYSEMNKGFLDFIIIFQQRDLIQQRIVWFIPSTNGTSQIQSFLWIFRFHESRKREFKFEMNDRLKWIVLWKW